MRCPALLFTMLLAMPWGLAAQGDAAARADFFGAVASFFGVPEGEIEILSDWDIVPDEIPVALFLAQQAGISPEALVALRSSGQNWATLAERYRVTASTLHLPIRDDAPTGTVGDLYDRYRATPVGEWHTIRLTDADIVALVGVRVIAQALGLPVEEVLRRTTASSSFVELYAELKR